MRGGAIVARLETLRAGGVNKITPQNGIAGYGLK
jgi:hypothetical protein